MPQIGWLEILIVVILAILIIGPKDFPFVIRKVGTWIGSIKSYFSEIQKDITEIESSVEDKISIEDNYLSKVKNKNKDE